MEKKCSIQKVVAREVLDSRGNPTVEAEVLLQDGTIINFRLYGIRVILRLLTVCIIFNLRMRKRQVANQFK